MSDSQKKMLEGVDVDYALIFTHSMITMRDALREAEETKISKEDQLDKIVKPIIAETKKKLTQARQSVAYDLEEWGV